MPKKARVVFQAQRTPPPPPMLLVSLVLDLSRLVLRDWTIVVGGGDLCSCYTPRACITGHRGGGQQCVSRRSQHHVRPPQL